MTSLLQLSGLVLRPLFGGLQKSLPSKEAGAGVHSVLVLLVRHFTDHSQRLPRALHRSVERAWEALDLALADATLWQTLRLLLGPAEVRGFRRQVRELLDTVPFDGLAADAAEFRRRCRAELSAARAAGRLTQGRLHPEQLARQVGALARHADPTRLLDAEWEAVAALARELEETGSPALGRFLAWRPLQGTSVLAAAARYFFRREIEEDPKLLAGLVYEQVDHLANRQEAEFRRLGDALAHQDELTQEVRADQQRLGRRQARQGRRLREINDLLHQLLERCEVQRAPDGRPVLAPAPDDAPATLEGSLFGTAAQPAAVQPTPTAEPEFVDTVFGRLPGATPPLSPCTPANACRQSVDRDGRGQDRPGLPAGAWR
jgi:hypothetical protein